MGVVVMLNKKGLTLVEVLIAMVVLLLVSLSMMQTAVLCIDSNMRNVLRDEAVSIAEQRMNYASSIPFGTLALLAGQSDNGDGNNPTSVKLPACASATSPAAGPYPVSIPRNIRNITGFNFGTRRTVTAVGSDMRVDILVRWQYENECFTHQISTVARRP
jgi:prepilin-type N-terminal cleavage/methylation domain-containing protein